MTQLRNLFSWHNTLLLALLSLLFAACQKENSLFHLTAQQYSNSSKEYLTGSVVYWSDGDQMNINGNTYTVVVDASNHNKATVDAPDATPYNGTYYAASPADLATVSGSTVTFTLPQSETYTTQGGGQHVANLMVASSTNNELSFQNLCAMLHFSLLSTASGAKLCAIEVSCDKPLWGTLQATHNGSSWDLSLPATAENTTRRLTFSSPLTLSATAHDFYLLVPPVSALSTFTLRYIFEDATGIVKAFNLTKSGTINLAQGVMYNFPTDTYNGSQVSNASAVASTNAMDGSAAQPYELYTAASWKAMMKSAATSTGKYFTLGADITLDTTFATFKAHLDGNNHTIKLSDPNKPIFNLINGGTVENLQIDADATADSPALSSNFFGFLACSTANGTITHCTNKASVTCTTATAQTQIGGICGKISSGHITHCLNEGNITSNATYSGGIVGYANTATAFADNTNSGNITLTGTPNSNVYCGGVAGTMNLSDNGDTITGCYNDGNITLSFSGAVTNCLIGGLFGGYNCYLDGCGNSGNINNANALSQPTYIGGLAGKNTNPNSHTILNCYNEGNITATTKTNMYVGGLVGFIINIDIYNSYAFCTLEGNSVAGITGYAQSLSGTHYLSNCYYYGTINASTIYGLSAITSSNPTNTQQVDHCYYPAAYTAYASGSSDGGNNEALSSALLLSGGASLATTLNAAVPSGGYSWTEGATHVVFAP